MVDRRGYWLRAIGTAALLLAGGCQSGAGAPSRSAARWEATPRAALIGAEGLASAKEDPVSFLAACQDYYDANVRDYRCRFIKEERIDGVLGAEQQMQVAFRQEPFSVAMRWIKNPGLARRVVYVAGRWSKDGVEQMHVELNGLLGVMMPGGVRRDINGKHARATSRGPINRFGFRHTLDSVIQSCQPAAGGADCRLEFVGEAELEGRSSLVFERRCVAGASGAADDERLRVVYVDREWLLPTGSSLYADEAGKVLLGRYLLVDVELNVGLTDADFE